jgi:hypothetical protein
MTRMRMPPRRAAVMISRTTAEAALHPGVNTNGPRGMEATDHAGATRLTYMRQPPSSSCPAVMIMMRQARNPSRCRDAAQRVVWARSPPVASTRASQAGSTLASTHVNTYPVPASSMTGLPTQKLPAYAEIGSAS